MLVALCMFLVLGGVNVICWGLYRRASDLIDAELDTRLMAIGRASVPRLSALVYGDDADRRTASRDLAWLREQNQLEQAFVLDPERVSVADARPGIPPGTRYDPLRLNPAAVERAFTGQVTASPHYQVADLAFKGAYVPIPDPSGAIGAVLYLEAGVELLSPLASLRDVLVVASLASAALALLLAVMLALGVRAVRRETVARSRAEHLGIMSRLAAQAAHEIKNPLSTIQATAETVEEVWTLPEDARELMHDLRDDVGRVSRLVEDFVALSPDIAMVRARHDLVDLVEAVATSQGPAAAADGVEIDVERPDGPVSAEVDAARIRQVLLNLVLNARQATPSGGRVTLAVAREGRQAVIEVRDTGRGMSAEELRRACDPFFTTREGGTGLGLAVGRQIAEAHGGRLTIASRKGQGTTCRLELPAGD